MWKILKSLLVFRVGQNTARATARMVGLGRLGVVIGLLGGWRALRHHRHG